MYNPSYLIKSRHGVFYFRYPLPIKGLRENRRISFSLRTRCPKEALRLAKALGYHSGHLLTGMDLAQMNHAEIMSIMKSYYTEVLEAAKARIDKDGPLPVANIQNIKRALEELGALVHDGSDDVNELLGTEYETPEDDPLKQDLSKIMIRHDLSFSPESREYGMMKSAYKHLRRNYYTDLLSYNSHVTEFSLLDVPQSNNKPPLDYKPEHKLKNIIKAYLAEIKSDITVRSYNEQKDCLNYMIDWLGEDYYVTTIDDAKAREVKELLSGTPKGRNKTKLTAGQSLLKQIAISKEQGLETLSNVSVNKYIGYFESMFNWAKRNRYIKENPFTGIRLKASKKKNRRELFSREEVAKIVTQLENDSLSKNKSNYWGALIAVYTGARRNEIAGLLPDDVKKDDVSGIWYFNITDEEEEGKALKTAASKRIVPVHSRLIEKGFLEFVEESRRTKRKIKQDDYEPRLLHHLTYTEHEKWGRNLGRWFNESYLKDIGLKTKKKTLHSLRHSLITYLGAAGVDGANIKSIVGHEPDTVTTAVYTHYGVDHLPAFKEAIEKLPY